MAAGYTQKESCNNYNCCHVIAMATAAAATTPLLPYLPGSGRRIRGHVSQQSAAMFDS